MALNVMQVPKCGCFTRSAPSQERSVSCGSLTLRGTSDASCSSPTSSLPRAGGASHLLQMEYPSIRRWVHALFIVDVERRGGTRERTHRLGGLAYRSLACTCTYHHYARFQKTAWLCFIFTVACCVPWHRTARFLQLSAGTPCLTASDVRDDIPSEFLGGTVAVHWLLFQKGA